MPARQSQEPLDIAIVGGSIVGCAAAVALASIDCRVTVLERSPRPLEARGSGLVLPRELVSRLLEQGLVPRELPWMSLTRRHWLVKDGEAPMGRAIWEQPFAVSAVNWASLYQRFRDRVPNDRYYVGAEVAAIDEGRDRATVSLVSGEKMDFDLVLAADGYKSTIRRLLFPNLDENYSGYVVWRGWFDEMEGLVPSVDPLAGAMNTIGFKRGHGNCWLIPSATGTAPGKRQVTWNIYGGGIPPGLEGENGVRAVPPGKVTEDQRSYLHRFADESFPPLVAGVMKATPNPIITPVYDVLPESFVSRRVALLGDASTVLRPVTGSGARKGLEDVIALSDILVRHDYDLEASLSEYDCERLPIGEKLVELGKRMGTGLVDEAPDWASMSVVEMEKSISSVMEGWYAMEDARDMGREKS